MDRAVRPRPPVLRALGRIDPPQEVEVRGQTCVRVDIFKHDSWAATARYRGPQGDVVCKFNRVQPILWLPMRWLGRWLAARERTMLRRLAGLRGIPEECGPVTSSGQLLRHAVAHDYVPGRPPNSRQRPPNAFFPELIGLLNQIHRRGIAYVDLHKRENMLVGEDGRPYLVDFQVCFGLWSRALSAIPPLRSVLCALQHLDWYCLAKHVRHHRRDQLHLLRSVPNASRPWWINVHRSFAVPLRRLRRGLLVAMGVRAVGGRAVSEAYPEDAYRCEPHGV
jgi:hypothetical protein